MVRGGGLVVGFWGVRVGGNFFLTGGIFIDKVFFLGNVGKFLGILCFVKCVTLCFVVGGDGLVVCFVFIFEGIIVGLGVDVRNFGLETRFKFLKVDRFL